jgi:hypothetical protein
MRPAFEARHSSATGWLQIGLLLIGMATAVVYGQHHQYELWESLDQGVRATVLEPAHCEEAAFVDADGDTRRAYKLRARYAYVIAGHSYVGTRLSRFKQTTFSSQTDCEEELIPMPMGQPLLAWASRGDPAQSVLDPRRPNFTIESLALLLGLGCCVKYGSTRHDPLPEPPDPSTVMDPEIDMAVTLALSVMHHQGFAQQQAAQSQATLTAAQRLAQTQDKAVLRACPDWLLTQLQQWVDEHRQTGHLVLAWEGMEEDQSALIQSIQHHFKA